MVLVRKKDGGLRICVDYRKLNAKTIPEVNPLPRSKDILDGLDGMRFFRVLDLKSAYHQGYMHTSSSHLTTFVCSFGLYEYVRILFGLRNAVRTFQRSIENVLDDLRYDMCAPYLDDTLIYSKTFDEHIENVRTVLRRLKSKGIKLNARKCNLFMKEVTYLGRTISKDGYRPDKSNLEAVLSLKSLKPSTLGDVRKLLGLLSYFRKYIQDFAKIANPIHNLLKANNNGKRSKSGQSPSNARVIWTDECQLATEKLIDMLISSHVMSYPDFQKPFLVHCDASGKGLGAILYQEKEGKMMVIGYASRSLLPAERNYHSSKLEFLCLKWAVCEHFRDYLFYARGFEVVTDNNPLLYCMSSSKLNATTARWVGEFADFTFKIRYCPGPVHRDVDILSRLPLDIDSYTQLCDRTVNMDSIDSLLKSAKSARIGTISAQTFHNKSNIRKLEATSDCDSIEINDFRTAQLAHDEINSVMKLILDGRNPSRDSKRNGTAYYRSLVRSFRSLQVIDGVLFRQVHGKSVLVVPPKYTHLVLHELHTDMGHLGAERVYQLAKERFYWPNMRLDIINFTTKCCPCIQDKRPQYHTQSPLKSISTSAPFEMIGVDFLELEKSGGYRYLLVIVDHFARYAEVYPTRNKTAKTAADKIYNQFVLRYGYPEKLHSDRGGEFTNAIWKELNSLCDIKKTQTTSYHPQGNGQVERFNRTLVQMLRTLSDGQKRYWHAHAQRAYPIQGGPFWSLDEAGG